MVKKPNLARSASILRENRWSSGIFCPHCLSSEVNKNGIRKDFIQQYVCTDCGKNFNDRTSTIFDKTKLNLSECFLILEMNDQDVSISSISRELGRSWRTVKNFLKYAKIEVNLKEISSTYSKYSDKEDDFPDFGCGNSEIENHLQNTQLK